MAAVPLYRELRRAIRRLDGRPLLLTAIRSGVVRRTRASQRAAELQLQAMAALGDLRQRAELVLGGLDVRLGLRPPLLLVGPEHLAEALGRQR